MVVLFSPGPVSSDRLKNPQKVVAEPSLKLDAFAGESQSTEREGCIFTVKMAQIVLSFMYWKGHIPPIIITQYIDNTLGCLTRLGQSCKLPGRFHLFTQSLSDVVGRYASFTLDLI